MPLTFILTQKMLSFENFVFIFSHRVFSLSSHFKFEVSMPEAMKELNPFDQ